MGKRVRCCCYGCTNMMDEDDGIWCKSCESGNCSHPDPQGE